MQRSKKYFLGTLLVLVALVLVWRSQTLTKDLRSVSEDSKELSAEIAQTSTEVSAEALSENKVLGSSSSFGSGFDALKKLKPPVAPEDLRIFLSSFRKDFREWVRSVGESRACELVIQWLKLNTESRQTPWMTPVIVGPDGGLSESPNIYVALLSELVLLKTPQTQDFLVERLQQENRSWDETALLSRGIQLSELAQDQKLDLLETVSSDWLKKQAAPSSGYIEAIDIFVQHSPIDLMPNFFEKITGECARSSSSQLCKAGTLALDRMAMNQNAWLLENQHEIENLSMRSMILSRLSPDAPNAERIARDFIRAPGISDRGKTEWIESYPNHNSQISYNLLSENLLPPSETLRKKDAKALEMLRSFLGDKSLAAFHERISKRIAELESYYE